MAFNSFILYQVPQKKGTPKKTYPEKITPVPQKRRILYPYPWKDTGVIWYPFGVRKDNPQKETPQKDTGVIFSGYPLKRYYPYLFKDNPRIFSGVPDNPCLYPKKITPKKIRTPSKRYYPVSFQGYQILPVSFQR